MGEYNKYEKYLLEFATTEETVLAMLWSGDPSDVVGLVEVNTSLSLGFVNKLETIVVDEDVGGTTLHLIGGNTLLDGADGGKDDSLQAFLVDRALNGDVRQLSAIQSWGCLGGEELGVAVELGDRSKDLCKTSDNDLSEEQSEEDLDWSQEEKGNANVGMVYGHFNGNFSETGSQHDDDDDEGEADQDCVLQMDGTIAGRCTGFGVIVV